MPRVTNEQAQLDIAKYLYHSETKKTVSPLVKKNYAYAADLLDARDIIEKQTAMLREMRAGFEIVRDNSLNTAHTMTKEGLEDTTDANRRVALALLEKCKDFS